MSETWRAGTLDFITYRSDVEPSVHSDFLFYPSMSTLQCRLYVLPTRDTREFQTRTPPWSTADMSSYLPVLKPLIL